MEFDRRYNPDPAHFRLENGVPKSMSEDNRSSTVSGPQSLSEDVRHVELVSNERRGRISYQPKHKQRTREHTIGAVAHPAQNVLTEEEQAACVCGLKKNSIFRMCSESNLKAVCHETRKREYEAGDVMISQGQPQMEIFLLVDGTAVRQRETQGKVHQVEIPPRGTMFGGLHVLHADAAYATVKCTTPVTAFSLSRESYRKLLATNPMFSEEVICGLSKEIRNYSKLFRTPILDQGADKAPILATSIAAGIESYYRSSMNSLINWRLTGHKAKELFPAMHIQLPARVLYINGFKGLRYFLDSQMPDKTTAPMSTKLLAAITPGVIMTPVSSLLEATNAGHMNPEPIWRRWTRGLSPRMTREVIFGIGLNQLSDYCEERTPNSLPKVLRNALGSCAAGVMSGYLSHVPHNLSTLKLLSPEKSYLEHYKTLALRSEEGLPAFVPQTLRRPVSFVMALLLPRGLVIRTAQIVGSYTVLNGTIHALKDW